MSNYFDSFKYNTGTRCEYGTYGCLSSIPHSADYTNSRSHQHNKKYLNKPIIYQSTSTRKDNQQKHKFSPNEYYCYVDVDNKTDLTPNTDSDTSTIHEYIPNIPLCKEYDNKNVNIYKCSQELYNFNESNSDNKYIFNTNDEMINEPITIYSYNANNYNDHEKYYPVPKNNHQNEEIRYNTDQTKTYPCQNVAYNSEYVSSKVKDKKVKYIAAPCIQSQYFNKSNVNESCSLLNYQPNCEPNSIYFPNDATNKNFHCSVNHQVCMKCSKPKVLKAHSSHNENRSTINKINDIRYNNYLNDRSKDRNIRSCLKLSEDNYISSKHSDSHLNYFKSPYNGEKHNIYNNEQINIDKANNNTFSRKTSKEDDYYRSTVPVESIQTQSFKIGRKHSKSSCTGSYSHPIQTNFGNNYLQNSHPSEVHKTNSPAKFRQLNQGNHQQTNIPSNHFQPNNFCQTNQTESPITYSHNAINQGENTVGSNLQQNKVSNECQNCTQQTFQQMQKITPSVSDHCQCCLQNQIKSFQEQGHPVYQPAQCMPHTQQTSQTLIQQQPVQFTQQQSQPSGNLQISQLQSQPTNILPNYYQPMQFTHQQNPQFDGSTNIQQNLNVSPHQQSFLINPTQVKENTHPTCCCTQSFNMVIPTQYGSIQSTPCSSMTSLYQCPRPDPISCNDTGNMHHTHCTDIPIGKSYTETTVDGDGRIISSYTTDPHHAEQHDPHHLRYMDYHSPGSATSYQLPEPIDVGLSLNPKTPSILDRTTMLLRAIAYPTRLVSDQKVKYAQSLLRSISEFKNIARYTFSTQLTSEAIQELQDHLIHILSSYFEPGLEVYVTQVRQAHDLTECRTLLRHDITYVSDNVGRQISRLRRYWGRDNGSQRWDDRVVTLRHISLLLQECFDALFGSGSSANVQQALRYFK